MRQALYRKYRSRSFDEVVGQDHITKTLSAAIKSGRISHAYLFTGPRGVGKTSIARILAHEVNQIPYDDESIHLDIIEIDAASNRRIDEVRDLREKVRIAPASAKYKVYIIDEVHMLTREAFNALLKTLEEPPAHCIFILATTEAHKLPETIISRTQRFEFKPIAPLDASRHLKDIATREKITIDKDALDLLADFGQGSFRDSISYLDQLSSQSGKITADDVRLVLGLPAQTEVGNLLTAIREGDISRSFESLQAIRGQGVEAAQAAAALAAEIRQLAASGQANKALIKLLKQLLEVPASPKPYDFLEIIILEASQHNSTVPDSQVKTTVSESNTSDKKSTPKHSQKREHSVSKQSETGKGFDPSRWDEVVEQSKTQAASVYTALRLARPLYEDGVLTLQLEFPLHQKKLEKSENKQLVSKIIKDFYGSEVQVRCVVDKSAFAQAFVPDELQDIVDAAPLSSINNIFGGAEVLES